MVYQHTVLSLRGLNSCLYIFIFSF
uniref:Uncharacterized protein n=1 Tax=Anguilla anguilla TaxID=7936 RepID=A0A0E9VTN9_ANGAN